MFGRIAPEYGKQLKTESDEYLKGLITTTEGVYNKWTGKYDLKFDKPVEAQFAYVDGPQKVMSSVYDDYKYLSDISDQRNLPQNEKEQLLKRFYADKGITSDLNRKRSEKQMEADISVDSEAQKERTKSNEKVYTKELEQVHNLAQSAPEIRSSAQNVYQLAVSPNANQVFGLFSNAGMRDAILGVIAESGTSKGINLGAVYAAAQKLGKNVPTIAGESPQDYQKRVDKNIGMTQQAAGQLAILEVNFRKLIQGQGQVTNQESQMVARIGPVLTDRPEVVALKAKAVIAKATLLQEVDAIIQRELETNPRATISSIRNNSQAYKNAYKDYDLYLQKIQRDVFKD